ncbi:hypothetical protein BDV23DRAFT_189141 [Aspergillus alliaceus]|uniref:Uncharacterized protein n=1 Tax=Petromyces alliaceus TaxID=209559 RepID=A0A5N7BRR2_PETAA|nr:hypothetical protein BDV23DRAFT_189141 [Aspergillus alliaceus]
MIGTQDLGVKYSAVYRELQVLGLQSTSIHRDVYLDEPAITNQPAQLLYAYADVFALTKPDITISPPAYGLIQVQTRVLTAATPVNLNIVPDSAGLKVSISGTDPVSLDLGPESGNSGVHLTILPGKVDVKYQKGYSPVRDDDLQASLETELQIALSLFWRKTSISVSLCSYIAGITTKPAIYPQLNAQGVALGQQLAAQVMTGPDIGHAPVLNIQNYETVRDALNTVSAFETQYTCFQDKKQSLDDQLKIRDTMIQQAMIQAQIHSYLKKSALGKYNDAQTHGISGKALAQAQAEAIKAGHEYVLAELQYIKSNKDIADLKELRAQFNGQEKIYAQVEAKFYSRFLGIRNSLTMEIRRLVWVYKYWALEDSAVELDSQKTAAQFQADLLTLDSEIESADEKYATDFQPFNYSVGSSKLPSDYGQQLIDGLRSESHRASFTLTADDPNGHQGFASIFMDGSRFRLNGLKTFLSGAFPNPEAAVGGVVQVDIQILTSGIYADIKDVTIWQFASVPRSVLLSYDLDAKGNRGATHVHATFPTKEHAELTLFM